MCGIAGIININGFQADQIHDSANIIRHRGPDDEGFLLLDDQDNLHCAGGPDTPEPDRTSHFDYTPSESIDSFHGKRFRLGFGHRRLSILDLSPTGHQPMSYSKGRYWIIFNGEIYNYQDIKNELQKLGHQFTSRTDTEVILAAYAEWGAECLTKFAGMWAFAIYDHKLKEIFLARDRYGIKPLYYWFSPDGCFCFASEIKQFTVLNGWQAKMNPPRVYDYLIYSFTDHTDETLFKGVYQLPSGSYYKSSINDIKPDATGRTGFSKWYSLEHKPFKGSFPEAAEMFRALFENSVKEHLYADVPVGTALSGGLDSSSIVCEINRLLMNNGQSGLQKTFSSCALDERYDEKKWMDMIIDHTRIDAHFIYPGINDVIESTSDLIWHQDEPYQSQSALLGYNVFRLAKANDVKVLLNGQGADEYLGGYGDFTMARYAKMIRQLKLVSLVNDIRNSRSIKPVSNLFLLRGIAFQLLPYPVVKLAGSIRSSSDHVKNVINLSKLGQKFSHPYEIIPVKYRSIPEISEHLTFYSTLPKYLRWEDRNSMAHSVEARVPFLDHRLVEFTYSLPDEFLEKDGINKRVMREAMNNLLPDQIKNRKDKMGFTTPEELWVKQENPSWFRQKMSDAVDLTGGIIKPEALDYFDRVVDGTVPFDYTYWRLILFSEWMQKFQIEV